MVLINRIRDWTRPFLQLCLLFIVIGICIYNYYFDVIQLTSTIITIPFINYPVKLNFDINYLKMLLGLLFTVGILCYIRSSNKDFILKQTLTNKIVWHTYYGYLLCSQWLNYKEISLTRVPIPMQFKLICNSVFKKYHYMEGVREMEAGTDVVKVEKFNSEEVTPTVNLVLADTYPLNWREQLPEPVINLTTIVIDRSNGDRSRYYSPDFVRRIVTEMRNLPAHVVTINLFATTNAAHSYYIATEVFSTGGRDSIKSLIVYEQSNCNGRKFEGEKYVIF